MRYQGLTETLYCRAAQEVSTQVQLLQAPISIENREENLPPGICKQAQAGPVGDREPEEMRPVWGVYVHSPVQHSGVQIL